MQRTDWDQGILLGLVLRQLARTRGPVHPVPYGLQVTSPLMASAAAVEAMLRVPADHDFLWTGLSMVRRRSNGDVTQGYIVPAREARARATILRTGRHIGKGARLDTSDGPSPAGWFHLTPMNGTSRNPRFFSWPAVLLAGDEIRWEFQRHTTTAFSYQWILTLLGYALFPPLREVAR